MMTFLISLWETKLSELLLLFGGDTSFYVYNFNKELTPLGWAVVIILPLGLIFRIIFLIVKFLKKPKLK
jgi:hypothetical protein